MLQSLIYYTVNMIVVERVVHLPSLPAGLHHAKLSEISEVLRDRWLGNLGDRREVAGAEFLPEQAVDDPRAADVGERPERLGQLGVLLAA